MTKEAKAQKIGYKYAFISNLIGLLSAILILMYLGRVDSLRSNFFTLLYFFTDFALNFSAGLAGMFITAYYLGKRAGLRVLKEQSNPFTVGILTGILVLIAGTFAGSLIGFFQEGWSNIGTHDNPFVDYLFKPLFWILSYGFIPVLIVGFWYGSRLAKKINKLD